MIDAGPHGFIKPYRLEFFQSTVGQIIHYCPVNRDGTDRTETHDEWKGQTTVQFPGAPPIQLQFDLPGPTLLEAIAAWERSLEECLEKVRSEMVKRAIASGAEKAITKQIFLAS